MKVQKNLMIPTMIVIIREISANTNITKAITTRFITKSEDVRREDSFKTFVG